MKSRHLNVLRRPLRLGGWTIVILAHRPEFRYRPVILAAVVTGALAVAFMDADSGRTDAFSDALSICVAVVFGYAGTRALVWLATRFLKAKWPRLVPLCGLICFYGAVPLLLLGLYVGSWATAAPAPSPATVAFVVAAAVSVAAGALAAVRAT